MVDIIDQGPGIAAIVGALDTEKASEGAEDVDGGSGLSRSWRAQGNDTARGGDGSKFGKCCAEIAGMVDATCGGDPKISGDEWIDSELAVADEIGGSFLREADAAIAREPDFAAGVVIEVA